MIKNVKTTEKIILCGEIKNMTPLIIGSGKDDHTDIDILLDPEGTPFIPATSFLGVLRHTFKQERIDDNDKKQFNLFWGNSFEKESLQSSIRCSDLYPVDDDNPVEIKIRDGVKIEAATGLVKDQEKYDFQLLERGVRFTLRLEISVRENQKDFCREMALCLKTILESDDFLIGAKTGNGFGQLQSRDIKIMIYDFTRGTRDIFKWLGNQEGEDATGRLKEKYPDALDHFNPKINFTLQAKFRLKTSLLINSGYSGTANAGHIMSKGIPALPGTSVKGTIRARANKIIKTLLADKWRTDKKTAPDHESDLIKELFGFVDRSDSAQDPARRTRIIVEEKYLPEFDRFEQYRIRVDRFTGGAINGALFSALAIGPPAAQGNSTENNLALTLKIKDCKNHEAGLILLVLKDLWTGDCALGGGKAIGRGVLEGVKADISFNTDQFVIRDRFDNLEFSNKNEVLEAAADLDKLIQALCHTITEGGAHTQEVTS